MHRDAATILDFWFTECVPEQHFEKDEALDAEIAHRFGALREAVVATGAAGWQDDADSLLAAIILIDQFGRNMHRGSAEAFATDPLALTLARQGVAKGYDAQLPPDRAKFLYMPFMHAEDAGAQAESVRLFEALGNAESIEFAKAHREVIGAYGRFPSRNAALGRESTPAERAYLSRPDAGW
ncbi:hypothetical protein COC42_14665 [Sphingomonas spermidinifaciens]|uniref:DUF924 domain-containing protein n=1 Tax=Sphingomonas spermidinifaciens TaxID=1141889 RepID=A0A2A4B2F6_9SPHN|nr:DUF924 family protein [Sphingomonas spermidinifaciens]PCD02631.1 hypothetical protein COC42_14665 [Sphingomonas spermidinifaciens]